ncbi:MAG: hypothetical protein PHO37_17480 [Kiritimatiellae bacterium]|nr:hypothetical protein [Kiritimatiellia bacterium]
MGIGFKERVLSGVLLLSVLRVCACDIPVFEYALKMWPPDAYELVVVHRDGEGAAGLLEQLRQAASGFANIAVRETAPELAQEKYGVLPEGEQSGALPWLIVRYPVRMDTRRLLWSGPAAADEVNPWMDSPMRRKISRLLLNRSVGVWVFLESSDRAKDEAAYARLESELSRLERVMKIQDERGTESDVTFEILRLSRHDPAEKMLLLMLTQSEPDLESLHAEPMVFPVYGRGIVLYALVGAGINSVTITETAEFLSGECSCEIKSQNPGLELLMTAEWEGDSSAPVGLAGFAERAEQAAELLESVMAAPSDEEAGGTTESDRGSRAACVKRSAGAVILIFLSAGMIWLFVFWRRRRVR